MVNTPRKPQVRISKAYQDYLEAQRIKTFTEGELAAARLKLEIYKDKMARTLAFYEDQIATLERELARVSQVPAPPEDEKYIIRP
jgi:aminoglycoside phosphotransferase